MTPRPAMKGETPLSDAELSYFYNNHNLWTTPKSIVTSASAENGWQESEPKNQELSLKEKTC